MEKRECNLFDNAHLLTGVNVDLHQNFGGHTSEQLRES